MTDAAIICPHCDGNGGNEALLNRGPDVSAHSLEWVTCRTCGGVGAIDAAQWDAIKAGRRMRELRIEKGQTLREAARALGISAAELSARENGREPTSAGSLPPASGS